MMRRRIEAAAGAALALAAAVLASGCNPAAPMNMLEPRSNLADWIYRLFLEVTGWDSFIFVVVAVALTLALFVFSSRTGEAAPPLSPRTDLTLEVAWTVGPAIILLFISIPTVGTIFRSQPPVAPKGALEVKVIAHQWWWEFVYPDGIDTANELHIPVGRPVRLDLQSADVIHSFWVPRLGGKRDVVPGQINHLTLEPLEQGEYWGQCGEFCGLSHANMRIRVFVDSPAVFAKWQADQLAAPVSPIVPTAASTGQTIFATSPCTTCHTIAGISKGVRAPNLSHFASRTTLAAGVLDNTPAEVARWITDPAKIKPGAQMPPFGVRGRQLADLVDYLESLK